MLIPSVDKPAGALWFRQATSDLACAERLRSESNEEVYCHIIAKYQQTVEKSLKAIAATATDADMADIKIKYNHEVQYCIESLLRLKKPKENSEIQNRIRGVLDEFRRGEIAALMALAPKQPTAGQYAMRNTEYPFQNSDGVWVVPSDPAVFRKEDVARFGNIATRIHDGAGRILLALARTKS